MKLLAIDGNSVLNRAFYGVRPLTTKDGVHTNAIFGFLNILFKLEREITPDNTVFAFDVSRKTFRNEQYDQYKANRKGMPDDLREQLPLIKEILTLMGYSVLGCEGYEGDDILGTIAKNCNTNNDECVIATGDRDCLQLVCDNVKVCLLKNQGNVLYDEDGVLKDFLITPSQVIDLKALMGDASDNIPGVKGVGEKTALTLITKYQSIENIYGDIESVEATPRVKKLLAEGEADAFMSKKLATIFCEVPLDCVKYDRKEPELDRLSELMTRLEMFSFFEKMNLSNSEANATTTIRVEYLEDESYTLAECIYVIYQNDTLYFIEKNKIFKINDEDKLYKAVADKNIKIRTFMAKPIIKKIKALGYNDVNIDYDLELACYLLNPSSKGYDFNTLNNRYLSDLSLEAADEIKDIAGFIYLCERTKKELEEQKMLSLYNEIELPLCEVLADMETEGFAIDVEGVKKFGERLEIDILALKQQIHLLAGEEFNVNSTKELGNILFEKLGLPAKKKTKTGYSTNADVLEDLIGKHEIIPAILEYRKLTKLQSTYVVGLLKVVSEDKRVHSTFNQTETRTGRISSTEPNVQNIPVRTRLGSEIRKFFVARDGYTLVDADYSQIELRILAHIANDKNMIDGFLNGKDIHAITASQVFHCPLEEMTSEIRSRAKAINFGIVYGIGAYSLSQDINVSVADAKAYINAYLETYQGVSQYMKDIVEKAQREGYVATEYGRRRDLSDINSTNKMVKAFAERVALNTPIQGTAADIIKLAMIKVHKRIKEENLDARLILQVHDELIIEAPAMQATMIKKMLKEEMENAARLAVPLVVDVNVGENWFIAKG